MNPVFLTWHRRAPHVLGLATLCLGLATSAVADDVPDPFQFQSREGVAPGSVHVSDSVVVSGIDQPSAISVSGAYYSINGRTYTTSTGTVQNGDSVTLRAVASALFSTSLASSLSIGGQSASFMLVTAAAPTGVPTPSLFKLDRLYVPEIDGLVPTKSIYVLPGELTSGAVIAVKGLSGPAPISIVAGTYSVNGGAMTYAPGFVGTGDSVLVSATAPDTTNDARSTTLTIGARAASLNLFTHADTLADTPSSLSGTTPYVVRNWGAVPQRAFVYKPKGWTVDDRRSALVFFFGGGWTVGNPVESVSWAKWAASKGMVGIAPDYRTNQRFATSPLSSVDDARAALRWVQQQAGTLGIDVAKIAVGGNSAGGHLALWTAITSTPPGSSKNTRPLQQPAAIVLISAVSDTSVASGYTPYRFGIYADALSPQAKLSPLMPPTIAFHGDADTTVSVTQSSRLCELMQAAGNVCQFVNVPGGNHSYRTQPGLPGDWKNTTNSMIEQFLRDQHLLP